MPERTTLDTYERFRRVSKRAAALLATLAISSCSLVGASDGDPTITHAQSADSLVDCPLDGDGKPTVISRGEGLIGVQATAIDPKTGDTYIRPFLVPGQEGRIFFANTIDPSDVQGLRMILSEAPQLMNDLEWTPDTALLPDDCKLSGEGVQPSGTMDAPAAQSIGKSAVQLVTRYAMHGGTGRLMLPELLPDGMPFSSTQIASPIIGDKEIQATPQAKGLYLIRSPQPIAQSLPGSDSLPDAVRA